MAKKYNIYGTSYTLLNEQPDEVDAYAYRNKIVDTPPNGKTLGYVIMDDGSVIECYKGLSAAIIVVPLVIVAVTITGIIGYFKFLHKANLPFSGLLVEKEEDDGDVISYNGFMSARNGELNIQFQNGSDLAIVTVEGKGIETEPVEVQPNELLETVPVKIKSKDGVIPSKIHIKTDTSEADQDVVVEVPDNNTTNSPDGLDGYWKGEYVYGKTKGKASKSK